MASEHGFCVGYAGVDLSEGGQELAESRKTHAKSALMFPQCVTVPTLYISMASAVSGMTGISAALNVLRRKGRLKKDERIQEEVDLDCR